jgi:excisionase family DNA binding protein
VEFLSLDETAQALNVTRRRAQALVEKGQLRAHRVGGRWLIEAADVYQRRRSVARRGRPLKASTAWTQLEHATLPRVDSEQDSFRRLLLPRAEHRNAYVHPSLIPEVRRDDRHVLGGRDAADAAGLPVGLSDEDLDVYLRAAHLEELANTHVVRFEVAKANLHLHVVPADAWPFTVDQRYTSLLVAWLDLADRGDRGERVVREQLLRKPL